MSIEIRGLSKAFRSGRRPAVHAVDDLSLEIADGELLVILGPSGSGKTTLLRCIAGLERADSGEIRVDGRIVYSSEPRVWVPPERRGISMVFQSYALWPHMSVFDNVAYPLRVRGVKSREASERVARALGMVGCSTLERRYPSEISGGQQQRVAVARAIVGGSKVILFDEPLSSVDARVREVLRHELVALHRELGFAAVHITHDQTEAMAIGHRVAVLADGKIIQVAAPRELYGRPASGEVAEFLGATNQFDGTILSLDDGHLTIGTELSSVVADRARPDLTAGQAVRLIVRPEDWTILPGGHSETANAWQGTVATSLFLGSCTEYLVRLGEDHSVTVRSTTKAVAEPNETIWLHVAPADIHVIPAR